MARAIGVGVAVWVAGVVLGGIITAEAGQGSPASQVASLTALIVAILVGVAYYRRAGDDA